MNVCIVSSSIDWFDAKTVKNNKLQEEYQYHPAFHYKMHYKRKTDQLANNQNQKKLLHLILFLDAPGSRCSAEAGILQEMLQFH